MWPHLDEPARRLVAASKAMELGDGNNSRVSRACGLPRVTLTKGIQELQAAQLPREADYSLQGNRYSKDPFRVTPPTTTFGGGS